MRLAPHARIQFITGPRPALDAVCVLSGVPRHNSRITFSNNKAESSILLRETAYAYLGDNMLANAHLKRVYIAELCWYERGRSEFSGRDKIDGHYQSIRTTLRGASLQEVVDRAVQIRRTKDGSQYPIVDLNVSSTCATCMGNRRIKKGRGWFSAKKCPDCKGADAKKKELTIRL